MRRGLWIVPNMVNRRGRKSSLIRLEICEDPTLHRFESLSEALSTNVGVIARLIRAGEQNREENETLPEQQPETTSVIEEV
jgi:hypothetical protein